MKSKYWMIMIPLLFACNEGDDKGTGSSQDTDSSHECESGLYEVKFCFDQEINTGAGIDSEPYSQLLSDASEGDLTCRLGVSQWFNTFIFCGSPATIASVNVEIGSGPTPTMRDWADPGDLCVEIEPVCYFPDPDAGELTPSNFTL